jgi:hypothetical protein
MVGGRLMGNPKPQLNQKKPNMVQNGFNVNLFREN